MQNTTFNFENLKVYQKSLEFMDYVYEVTLPFPVDERFNLTSQFRRASLSISLNIAEGTGASNKQNLHYLDIATRSTKECVVCATASSRRKYIDEKVHEKLRSDLTEIKKMISGLANYPRKERHKKGVSRDTPHFTQTLFSRLPTPVSGLPLRGDYILISSPLLLRK